MIVFTNYTSTRVFVKHSNYQIFHIKHHTCLKYIFKKLIISNSTPCFYFNNNVVFLTKSVRIKGFIYRVVFSKKNGNIYFFVTPFSSLNIVSTTFKMRSQ